MEARFRLRPNGAQRTILILVLAATLTGSTAAFAQMRIQEDFEKGALDWSLWCPCQINMTQAPIAFHPDPDQPGDRILRIQADDASLGGNVCRSQLPHLECRPPPVPREYQMSSLAGSADGAAAELGEQQDMPEPLGPTLIGRTQSVVLGSFQGGRPQNLPKNPYCTDEVIARAEAAGEEGTCVQRQELRLQRAHAHGVATPYLYSFRFRMPERIEDRENSIRWVIAQWKQEPVSESYAREFSSPWGPSPFLAQRFDDGVLHVTVQDEHCRCIVASAPFPDGSNLAWYDGVARHCVSTKPGPTEGQACRADLRVEYGPAPILSSALGQWVEMRYRVQAGRSGDAVVEVHEGERFIVRITGKIGYEPAADRASIVKFKIGQYRDYMPFTHALDLDWVRVAPVPE